MSRLLKRALKEYGVTEIPGEKDNPRILRYFKLSGHSWADNDEYAWCSAFMNWCAKKVGVEHTGKLNARSWLDVGEEVIDPKPGDVVVFWRESPDSWKGHVAIYINERDGYINVLGGNQGNKVCIAPYNKSRLLGYRRLRNEKEI